MGKPQGDFIGRGATAQKSERARRSLGSLPQPNSPFALVKDSWQWRSQKVKPLIAKARKTNEGRWSRSGSTSALPTIAFFRAGTLLRRHGPVPGILAAHRPGAIMDKSGRRGIVRLDCGRAQKSSKPKPRPNAKASTIFS